MQDYLSYGVPNTAKETVPNVVELNRHLEQLPTHG